MIGRYFVSIHEGQHRLKIAECDTIEEAKQTALDNVDDALPDNKIVVTDGNRRIGYAYLAKGGDNAGGAEWVDTPG